LRQCKVYQPASSKRKKGVLKKKSPSKFYSIFICFTGSQYSDINGALLKALEVSKKVKEQISLPANVKQMIFFMTDGQATAGATKSIVNLTYSNLT
jgi:hypothetical protein